MHAATRFSRAPPWREVATRGAQPLTEDVRLAPPPQDTDSEPSIAVLERYLSKRPRACPSRSRIVVSKAVIDLARMYVGASAGGGRELKRVRPLPTLGRGAQIYMLKFLGVVLIIPRAIEGSWGRRHIFRGHSKSWGASAPGSRPCL